MKDAPTPRFSAADRIKLALALTAAILVVEIAGGLWAHSLALLSDAGHLVTDLLVLGFSAFALFQGRRPANPRKTFGYHRVGILVALGNALILGVVVVAIVVVRESTPSDLRPAEIVDAVRTIPGVRDLHDLHLWALGAEIRAMSAHLLVEDQRVIQAQEILAEVRELLAHRFQIEHTTIQFE